MVDITDRHAEKFIFTNKSSCLGYDSSTPAEYREFMKFKIGSVIIIYSVFRVARWLTYVDLDLGSES